MKDTISFQTDVGTSRRKKTVCSVVGRLVLLKHVVDTTRCNGNDDKDARHDLTRHCRAPTHPVVVFSLAVLVVVDVVVASPFCPLVGFHLHVVGVSVSVPVDYRCFLTSSYSSSAVAFRSSFSSFRLPFPQTNPVSAFRFDL